MALVSCFSDDGSRYDGVAKAAANKAAAVRFSNGAPVGEARVCWGTQLEAHSRVSDRNAISASGLIVQLPNREAFDAAASKFEVQKIGTKKVEDSLRATISSLRSQNASMKKELVALKEQIRIKVETAGISKFSFPQSLTQKKQRNRGGKRKRKKPMKKAISSTIYCILMNSQQGESWS